MQKLNSVVAVYSTHPQAEEALRAFQGSGFDMKKLSIVGKDYHTEENVVGFYNAGDRMKFWGKRGAFWGTFWGMLFGSALFLIPGVGHLIVLGPLVTGRCILNGRRGAAATENRNKRAQHEREDSIPEHLALRSGTTTRSSVVVSPRQRALV